MERVAIVDMGSNSWRLVIYGYEPGTPWWSMVDEIREAVRVGAGMGEERRLQPERIDRALHTAAVFASFCRASDIEEVEAVATSAIRDAVNSDELLAAIREQTGLEPRVISGTEEARYGYLAIVNSTTIEDGFGLDIGGGSIQGLAIEGRRLVNAQSLPLGSVNVSERFLPGEKAPAKAMKALRKEVTGQLEEFGWWEGGGRIVGIGGTIRNLAAAAMRRADLPRLDVQGFRARARRPRGPDRLARLKAGVEARRRLRHQARPRRRDPGRSARVAAAMDAGGFDGIEVTEAGMREGVFFERLLGGPALFEDVRSASVENLAHRFNGDTDHVDRVARLSLEMFDGLGSAGLHEHGAAERELLWAACMLHDIGTAIDYEDHHHHSNYLILNTGLPGFSARELMLVGLVTRYHRKGDPDVSQLRDLALKGDDELLRLLSGIIRLSEQFERSRDGTIRQVSVATRNGAVVLGPRSTPPATRAFRSGPPAATPTCSRALSVGRSSIA